jgi:hypothetical protein
MYGRILFKTSIRFKELTRFIGCIMVSQPRHHALIHLLTLRYDYSYYDHY